MDKFFQINGDYRDPENKCNTRFYSGYFATNTSGLFGDI